MNEADAIALANERYATIGSSYEQHLKEQTGPGTLSDALKILVPTVVTELALFTSAYQHLSPVEMLLGGGLGYLFADLEVGLYHFAMDKLDWTSPKISSEVRKNVIFFNLHHDDPAGCTKHSYWGLTRASYILNFIFIAGAGISSLSGHPLLSCVLASTGLIATQGQFFHSLAHRNPKENNAFIRFLQKHHIILNPQFHNKHHTAPYESHFSVLTGRMNSVVDLIVNNGGWSVCKFFANPAKQD